MPDFLQGMEFWKVEDDFGYFSQFPAAHAQKRPLFYFPVGCFLLDYEFLWRFCRDLCGFWSKTAFIMHNLGIWETPSLDDFTRFESLIVQIRFRLSRC